MIVSNTGASRVQISIENDELSDIPVGYAYEEKKPEGYFEFFDLYNPNASSVTVEYIISTGLVTPVPTISDLAEIKEQLQGLSTGASYGNVSIGLAQGSVLAANSDRHSLVIQSDPANGGIVYLGYDNTVLSTKAFVALQAGQSYSTDDWLGAIHAIASVAAQVVHYGEH
jgi:hypothetical protein